MLIWGRFERQVHGVFLVGASSVARPVQTSWHRAATARKALENRRASSQLRHGLVFPPSQLMPRLRGVQEVLGRRGGSFPCSLCLQKCDPRFYLRQECPLVLT